MRGWKLTLKRGALEDLRSLPKEARGRAALAVLGLSENPLGPGVEKLSGYEDMFRVRVGEYRVVYEIVGDTVTVIAVRDRKDIYRELR